MTLPDFRNPDDLIGNVGTVGEFWRWAMSDLLGNRNRGILAEYLVGRALLGVLTEPRMEWNFYVTTTRNLETHLQPKAASIGLTMIRHICREPVAYGELKGRVDHLLFGGE